MSLSSEQRTTAETEALRELAAFPLLEALYGRRSRRFGLGGAIPDGPLAYRSRHEPLPLTELERMLVLSAMGGTTGWHYSITRNPRYAPHPANYAGAAARIHSSRERQRGTLFHGAWCRPTRRYSRPLSHAHAPQQGGSP